MHSLQDQPGKIRQLPPPRGRISLAGLVLRRNLEKHRVSVPGPEKKFFAKGEYDTHYI